MTVLEFLFNEYRKYGIFDLFYKKTYETKDFNNQEFLNKARIFMNGVGMYYVIDTYFYEYNKSILITNNNLFDGISKDIRLLARLPKYDLVYDETLIYIFNYILNSLNSEDVNKIASSAESKHCPTCIANH